MLRSRSCPFWAGAGGSGSIYRKYSKIGQLWNLNQLFSCLKSHFSQLAVSKCSVIYHWHVCDRSQKTIALNNSQTILWLSLTNVSVTKVLCVRIFCNLLWKEWLLSLISCLLYHVFCIMSPVSCLLSHISCIMSHVSCLMSSVSHLWSHISCLTSPVWCLQSHISCLTSPVSSLLSHFSCLQSLVSCLTSPISFILSPLSCHKSLVKCVSCHKSLFKHVSWLTSPVSGFVSSLHIKFLSELVAQLPVGRVMRCDAGGHEFELYRG